jgi:sulfate-transporting ATPase
MKHIFTSIVSYQEYEADRKRRLGEEGAEPKRIQYMPISR